MEELQSTEILDREILEDARKKAQRILKTADDTVRGQTALWENKTAKNAGELEKKYKEQRELIYEKTMARLPIDKRRAKIEKIEEALNSAEQCWFNGLSRARIIDLLTGELAKRITVCGGQMETKNEQDAPRQLDAKISGLERKEAEAILKNVRLNCVIKETAAVSRYPSITIDTGEISVTASIQNIIDFLLHEKREELIEALVGRDFMESE
ncbi:MAG: hypothetical protein LBH16_08040 [Treponema sp.]|jgi:hypothetical protein|nr:hypothetical protein [Treponema sp.]